jgi:hypothetical protein
VHLYQARTVCVHVIVLGLSIMPLSTPRYSQSIHNADNRHQSIKSNQLFYDFSIGFWHGSDSVVFFTVLTVWYSRTVPTVWYFRTVLTVWYFRTVPTVWYFCSSFYRTPTVSSRVETFSFFMWELAFFRNACSKSGSLRFSQFSGCWLILSVYILMSLFGVR